MSQELFEFLSWTGVALGFFLGLYGIRKYGGNMFRPSFVVLGMYHLIFQWPLAVASDAIYDGIPNAVDYLALINGFVVFGTIGCLLITSRFDFGLRGFFSGGESQRGDGRDFAYTIGLLFSCLLFALGVYFYYVPYDCTGFYAMLHSPGLLNAVRELSLKLLTDSIPKYTYSVFRSVFLPLLVAVFALYFYVCLTSGKYTRSAAAVVAIIFLFPLSLIVGAKGDAVYIMLVIAVTFMVLAKTFRAKIFLAGVAVVFGLALMTLITLLVAKNFSATEASIDHFHACERNLNQHGVVDFYLKRYSFEVTEVSETDPDPVMRPKAGVFRNDGPPQKVYVNEQFEAMVARIFKTPTMVAGWYFDFVQQEGFVGVSGLPRLATLMRAPSIDLPNRIGVRYAEHGQALKTISAVTGYVVWWYACFGLVSLGAALVALWLLDVVLFAFLRCVKGVLRVPAYAALMVVSTKFVESDWAVVWITHGFLIVAIAAIVVDRISRFLAEKTRLKQLI